MKYNRFLVLIIPVLIFIVLELVLVLPKFFYLALVLGNLLLILAVWLLQRKKFIEADWRLAASSLITPALFLTSLAVYAALSSSKLIIHGLFLMIGFFLYFYLKSIYYYFINSPLYKSQAFKSLAAFGNLLVVFFSASSIYWLQSFLGLPVWLLMLSFLILILIINYQIIWINRISIRTAFIFIMFIGLVLLEIGWSISFLPLNYKVTGLILAICYYVLSGITWLFVGGTLESRATKLYLSFGFIGISLILLTARWL